MLSSDYRPIPALDRYEQDVLDDDDYDAISQTERMAAEREMARRDRDEGLHRGGQELMYGKYCIVVFMVCTY